ncbi:MAG TPA: HAD family hydrolase [Planctomycetaceae bacterium]|nr:HAD family hydrolase [Planctomycetaceae bacterium]
MTTATTLNALTPTRPYLIAIDSDGCAFDSMEIKHKECFIPAFIHRFGLQAVSKSARECGEFVNLYSKDRGVNRFPAYLKALDLLRDRPEVLARGVTVPLLPGLRAWLARETKLGTKTIVPEAARTGDPDLQTAAAWSQDVDARIADMVHAVPPFPYVRQSLQKIVSAADVIVCSATPIAALQKEWDEHGLSQYVRVICGQEVGSKKEILATCLQKGWTPDHILMIGDAPGDRKAAEANGCRFFPINPGAEEASWRRFFDDAADRFFADEYAGEYERALTAEFDARLPLLPPWV